TLCFTTMVTALLLTLRVKPGWSRRTGTPAAPGETTIAMVAWICMSLAMWISIAQKLLGRARAHTVAIRAFPLRAGRKVCRDCQTTCITTKEIGRAHV